MVLLYIFISIFIIMVVIPYILLKIYVKVNKKEYYPSVTENRFFVEFDNHYDEITYIRTETVNIQVERDKTEEYTLHYFKFRDWDIIYNITENSFLIKKGKIEFNCVNLEFKSYIRRRIW